MEYCKMIKQQFKYLKSCINKGQLIDKKLNSPLTFQYHYASFILSSILLKDYSKINEVLEFYLGISKNRMKPSNDFNVMLLSYAIMYDKDNILDKERILKSFYHNSDKELYKLNNNFRALRLVGMILDNKLSNKNLMDKINDEIKWILNLQFDDGFFPDSNMEYKVEKNKGIPHLVYHTKIMMCVGLAYLYKKDERLKESFFKALQVLLEISIEDYYFFYGRSTNSLFGYGSLYVVLIMAYKFSNNEMFLKKAESMLKFLADYQHNDGHISINLNKDYLKRVGFDGYMYDIVYNAYFNALVLLANTLKNELPFEEFNFKLNNEKIKVYKNSGFVVYQDKNIKYCFNFKGHQNSLKHRWDSRVSALSLLYYKKNRNILPAVSYIPKPILRLVEKKFPIRIIYCKLYKFFNQNLIPIFSGNNFYYTKNNKNYYIFESSRILKLGNKLIIKYKTKTLDLKYEDKCVVSINLDKNIEYKIFLYDKVDNLIYSVREEIDNNIKDVIYKFNQKNKLIKYMKIETSYKYAKVNFYRFDNIDNLKIKVINEKY